METLQKSTSSREGKKALLVRRKVLLVRRKALLVRRKALLVRRKALKEEDRSAP